MNYPNWKDQLPDRSLMAASMAEDAKLYEFVLNLLAEKPIDVAAACQVRPKLLECAARARKAGLSRTAKDLAKLVKRLDRAIARQHDSLNQQLRQPN